MDIKTTSFAKPQFAPPAATRPAEDSQAAPPTDSVTLGGGADKVKNTLLFGALGAVPVMGAGSNAMAAWATGWDDASKNGSGVRSMIGLGGAVANVAGTVTGVVGLFTGSETARMVGLGLLGASGVAGASMAALS